MTNVTSNAFWITNVFSYVPNIGDSRSLIVNPTGDAVPADYYDAAGVSDNLIRLSIGLENIMI
ncbi:MAG: O-acetylhomoserine aminocarboxypropyltransferase/cysteine synthase [Bifidobacterium dentium]